MLGKFSVSPRSWETLMDARKVLRDKIHYRRGQGGYKIKKCLTYNGGNDFTLNEDRDSVWIQVDEYVIYIRRNEKAVTAEIISPEDTGKFDTIDNAVGYWKKKERMDDAQPPQNSSPKTFWNRLRILISGNLKRNRKIMKRQSAAIEIGFADDDGLSLSPARIDRLKTAAKSSVEATAVVFNAILATNMAKDIDRWMREEFASGLASISDKAMDAARQKMQEFGGDHRLFDDNHDLIGAWKAVASAKSDDPLYLTSIWTLSIRIA